MRTTLDIDKDILETAKEIARKEKKSAGAVISELARRGFYAEQSTVEEGAAPYGDKNGVPVLSSTGTLVTEESIRRIRDRENI